MIIPAGATRAVRVVSRFLDDEAGATLVEYAVMVALIAAICVVVIKAIGAKSNDAFTNVNSALS